MSQISEVIVPQRDDCMVIRVRRQIAGPEFRGWGKDKVMEAIEGILAVGNILRIEIDTFQGIFATRAEPWPKEEFPA